MIARFRFVVPIVAVVAMIFVWTPIRADHPRAFFAQIHPEKDENFKAGDFRVTSPVTYDNLTVYLIHGEDHSKGRHYTTLQKALQDKIVVVYETGSVNQLQIENLSRSIDVYIQSGEIVKGGRQDRSIATDFIVPPRSGKMPIDAFCVENHRWTQRGAETAVNFTSSSNSVAGKDIKLAIQKSGDQGGVWQGVAQNQDKLSANAGAKVTDDQSASSLELTLENKDLQKHVESYTKSLAGAVDGQSDAIGYVSAINGKVSTADVYASHELFLQLWPKLINSASVEAFAELKRNRVFEPVKAEAVAAAIEDADKGEETSKDVTPRVQCVTHEAEKSIVFETRDRQPGRAGQLGTPAPGGWIHRSYLTKEPIEPPAPAPETPAPTGSASNQIVQQPGNANQRR